MKRFLLFVFAVAGMALSLTSCSTDDDKVDSKVLDSNFLKVPNDPVNLSALPYEADAAVYEFGENAEGIESIELTADGQYIAKYRNGAMPRNCSEKATRSYYAYGYITGTFTKTDANTFVLDGLFTFVVVDEDEVMIGRSSIKVTVTRPSGTTDTDRLCRRWYPVSLHIYLRIGNEVMFNMTSSNIAEVMYKYDKSMRIDDYESVEECLEDIPEYVTFTRGGRYVQYFPQDDYDPYEWSNWSWLDNEGHIKTWDDGDSDHGEGTIHFSGNDMYYTVGMEAELDLEDLNIKKDVVCFKYQWRFSEKKH